MRKLYASLVILLLGMLVISACTPVSTGGDQNAPTEEVEDEDEPGDQDATDEVEGEEDDAEEGGEGEIEVELYSYEIEMPATLKAGTITFHIENEADDEEHSFAIEGNGVDVQLDAELQPGEEGTLTVELAPGTYRIYCPVEDHAEEHGMELEVTVE
jgi:plastocyanin